MFLASLVLALMTIGAFAPASVGYSILFVSSSVSSSYSPTTIGFIPLSGEISVRALPPPATLSTPISIPLRAQTLSSGSQNQVESSEPLAGISLSQSVAVKSTISGLGFDGVTPPDVQVAAGPVNILEEDNLLGGIWTKAGSLVTKFSLSSFYGTGKDFISDPKVLFDASSGRWFTSLVDVTKSSILLAVSKTSDATGSFCIFAISSAPNLPDQPILGISNDKVVVSANDFAGKAFVGAEFWVLNKSQMVSCSRPSFAAFGPNVKLFSVHPVQSLTSTTTQFMVMTKSARSGSFIEVFSVTGVPPGPVSVSTVKVSVSSIKIPPSAVQLGTSNKLDTRDFRVQDAIWSNNMLWLAHNNKCTPSGDTAARSCLHIVEISTSTNTVLQDFNLGASGKYYFYPALRLDSIGNLLVIFGFSSSGDFPGLDVTEQGSGGPPNTLQTPVLLKSGSGPVAVLCSGGLCRYGDYFGAGVDPSTTTLVWVAGEFGSGTMNQWATEIGSITG